MEEGGTKFEDLGEELLYHIFEIADPGPKMLATIAALSKAFNEQIKRSGWERLVHRKEGSMTRSLLEATGTPSDYDWALLAKIVFWCPGWAGTVSEVVGHCRPHADLPFSEAEGQRLLPSDCNGDVVYLQDSSCRHHCELSIGIYRGIVRCFNNSKFKKRLLEQKVPLSPGLCKFCKARVWSVAEQINEEYLPGDLLNLTVCENGHIVAAKRMPDPYDDMEVEEDMYSEDYAWEITSVEDWLDAASSDEEFNEAWEEVRIGDRWEVEAEADATMQPDQDLLQSIQARPETSPPSWSVENGVEIDQGAWEEDLDMINEVDEADVGCGDEFVYGGAGSESWEEGHDIESLGHENVVCLEDGDRNVCTKESGGASTVLPLGRTFFITASAKLIADAAASASMSEQESGDVVTVFSGWELGQVERAATGEAGCSSQGTDGLSNITVINSECSDKENTNW
eukprot:TRINITY_DN6117_c0_g2_i1.p1 TRINITY_DN6117_c0_g2~~TRINITY_DN6117_c0_g2_i1.p1  ORF type:complete len:491 (-),score=102.94 TRINITY_DN6117_c0_g2_i1:218-1582(-)